MTARFFTWAINTTMAATNRLNCCTPVIGCGCSVVFLVAGGFVGAGTTVVWALT